MKDFLQGKWLGHPLHPILAHLPAALWPAALLFDVLSWMGIGGNAMVQCAFYAILFGLLGAILAVPAGLADFWDIGEDKPARRIGLFHLSLNVVALAVWSVNLAIRMGNARMLESATLVMLGFSIVGTLIVMVSGYLGGRMVYDQGTSVARLSKQKWRERAEAGQANVPPK